jgi:hypothetical protein
MFISSLRIVPIFPRIIAVLILAQELIAASRPERSSRRWTDSFDQALREGR